MTVAVWGRDSRVPRETLRPPGSVRGDRLLVGLLLVILLVLTVASMQHLSETADEAHHFRYGRSILALNSSRPPEWTAPHDLMPASALNALPSQIGDWLGPGEIRRRLAERSTARYATVLFSVFVAVFVFRWARELYGSAAGLLALTLYTFDPNILAHSQLVTGDVYATGMITLSLYCFWRYLNEGGWRRATASGLVLGVSQLAKYTCVFLYPIFGLIGLGRCAPVLWAALVSRRGLADLGRRLLRVVPAAVVLGVLSVLVINGGFLFNRTFVPLTAYHFQSGLLHTIQPWLRPVEGLRVPVPSPYLEGIDWLLVQERRGIERRGYNIYLFGELGNGGKRGRTFPGYYFYASLFKVPLATQVLILAAIIVYARRFRAFSFRRNEWLLFCPVLVFSLYFNFFYRLQIGIRHYLVVFPLLYVFAGSLLKKPDTLGRWAKACIAGLLVYLVASVLSYYPHYLPYFNELVWDRKEAYRILVDSNLDWGQDRWYVNQWLKQHPEAIVEPKKPRAGTIVVGANWLVRPRFRWLRENFEPVEQISYAHLVFRVAPEDLRRIEGPTRP